MSRKEAFEFSSTVVDRLGHLDYGHRIKMAFSALSFWLAIVLPGVNLVVLSVDYGGIDTGLLFFALLVLNALALVGGRPYRDSRDPP
ncbi:hypothetical protein [Halopenitus persicus]|uniref:hypothetical protein n=1 Tax=Halopenitus persicus TaxID=1048396 RepID=UPI000BBB39CA|nr:hypothetical protein [Halopenitus persicus]